MNICPVQIKSSFYQHFPGTGCIQQYLPDTLDHVTLLHEIEKFVKWQQQYDHSSLTEKVIFCQTPEFHCDIPGAGMGVNHHETSLFQRCGQFTSQFPVFHELTVRYETR